MGLLVPGETPAVTAAQSPLPAVFEPGVKDPAWSLLVGMLAADRYGVLTRQQFETELAARETVTRLPIARLDNVERVALAPGSAIVVLRFAEPLREPVPYSILGYRPGAVLAAERCVLNEWMLGTWEGEGVRLDDVHLFALSEGRLWLDVAAWLDALLGSTVDDAAVDGWAVYRRGTDWYATVFAVNQRGQARSGSFDFAQDRLMVSLPSSLKLPAKRLRAVFERLRHGQPPTAPAGKLRKGLSPL